MQNHAWPLLIVFAITTSGFAEETASDASLAGRLDGLRKAYAVAEQADSSAKTSTLSSVAAVSERSASNEQSRLPRVDPRSLLPKPWYGKAAASDLGETSTSKKSLGSAGARLMRDVRRGMSITSDGDIGAAMGTSRAGSVLSGSRTSPQAETPTTASEPRPSRATAALARSIASEVAESIAVERPTATGDRYADAAQEPVESEEDFSEETIDDLDETSARAESSFAKQDAKVSVSRGASSSRLPLTIGGESDSAPQSERKATSFTSKRSSSPSRRLRNAPARDEGQLLVTQKMPVIVSRVSGPRTIVVGREATYRVTIDNRGDATANRLVARVSVPEWAEVVGWTPSSGNVESPSSYDQTAEQVCQWRMDRLSEGAKATLDLRLIAKTGRPIELGVSWEHAPVDAMTVVEVQEPKLTMHLSGPDEVLFGKSQLFRLTVSNPGTGVAEGVRLQLIPPGENRGKIEHSLDSIAAGDSRSVEIELTAREAGSLLVEANVTAEGGLGAEASKEIFCRKPELAVDWRGPDHRYAGAPAVYFFRVRNPGTAVAQRVRLTVDLPDGFEVTPSAETPESNGGRLSYRVGTLRPGDDRYFELRGVMRTAGTNQLTMHAEGEDETRSETVTAETEVVALADLKLDIQDPRGPIATGDEVAYKIRVTNRGASEARDVNVVGLFSEGIEPGRAEGASSNISINDGRVAFGTIQTIPAGASREFTIYARAHEEGTHLFRTEVTCRDLEIQLAAEETTRFFEDEPIDIADSESSYRYQR